eukprot:4378033-Amphidinium_carterae.1
MNFLSCVRASFAFQCSWNLHHAQIAGLSLQKQRSIEPKTSHAQIDLLKQVMIFKRMRLGACQFVRVLVVGRNDIGSAQNCDQLPQ